MNKNLPEVRFKYFKDEYERKKLNQVVEKLKSYPLSRDVETSELTGFKYIHYGDIHRGKSTLIVDEFVLPSIKKGDYMPLQKGDIVIADASEDYQGIATPALLLTEPKQSIIAGLHTIALRVDEQYSPIYLYYLLTSPIFKKYGYKAGTGMKVFGISYSSLVKFESLYPSKKEQDKIGNLLKQLDDTIALQHRLIDQQQKYKKAMLQKMFPKKGERVPKIRFEGYKEEWESKALEDIVVNIGTGKSKYTIHNKSSESPYEILGSTSILGYDTNFDYEGDFILTARVGANAGTLYSHSGKVKITDNTVYIQNDNLDFIYYALDNIDLRKLSFGTGQPLIKASELKALKILTPVETLEQGKIGAFFKQLDNTISLHLKKLEDYKQLKKALLQRMFV
ncbi:restriction endonuclease subunit S [Sutcliffiella cohnii]|uniref:restriction endonuclease subunit S n=1 Tax=Sutcliffiella cohnii TaxID=33932 RepID=UPI00082BC9C7|nr:restriction endonuclease subunit S [Sutcliffiella cohnii]